MFETVLVHNEVAHTASLGIFGEDISFYKHINTHKDSASVEPKVVEGHRAGRAGDMEGLVI